MREAPPRAEDREFLVTYWQKMQNQRECEEGGLAKQRELIREKMLSEIINKPSTQGDNKR